MNKIFYLISVLAISFLLNSCSEQEQANFNIMSFNIRYDNPEDSLNNWKYRENIVAQIIKDQKIDIVGTQEVLHNQLVDLIKQLADYQSIGVGREDGIEKGEYSALFYNKNRFDEINTGYFWLSETPEVAGSLGWDGACERIATWAILKDKESKKELFIINTHLDHVGKLARQEGVTLLIQRASELSKGLPIIITGDFNASPQSDVIKHVLDDNNPIQMEDSRLVATTQGLNTEGEWTFHGFGEVPIEKREYIDYIFVSEDIQVDEFTILPEKLNNVYLSDHRPIVAKITIK